MLPRGGCFHDLEAMAAPSSRAASGGPGACDRLAEQIGIQTTMKKKAPSKDSQPPDHGEELLAELAQLYQNAPLGLCLLDRDLRYLRINERLAAINGRPVDEHIGRTLREVIPEIAETLRDAYRQVIRTGEPVVDQEIRAPAPTDPTVEKYWLVSLHPIKDRTGSVRAISTMVQEITNHKQAKEALRASEEQYQLVAETATDSIISIDEDSRIVYANPATKEVFGFEPAEVIGQSLMTVMPSGLRGRHVESLRKFIATGKKNLPWNGVELTGLHRDGHEFPIEISFGALRQPDGTLLFTGIVRDISERKRIEHERRRDEQNLRRLLEGAKEEERRRLARELHDDLSQRLAALAIETARLEREHASPSPKISARLRTVNAQLLILSEDVHSIARRLHPSILDDLGLVDAIASECHTFSEREGIPVSYSPTRIPELLNETSLCLYRVTQESLANIARHARATRVEISLAAESDRVRLSIRDAGVGFDPDRETGKGGLGLVSIRERIGLIGGGLSIRSHEGEGTTVEVWAPLATGTDAQGT